MKQTINFDDFSTAFARIRPGNFTYNGLKALWDYLEEYEESTSEEIELDVIALCCEYTEYKNLEEFNENYNPEYHNIEEVEENTTVILVEPELNQYQREIYLKTGIKSATLAEQGFIIQDF